MATIKVQRNGPYVIEEGDVQIGDWNGRASGIAFEQCRARSRTN
jgi:hypothetical protein